MPQKKDNPTVQIKWPSAPHGLLRPPARKQLPKADLIEKFRTFYATPKNHPDFEPNAWKALRGALGEGMHSPSQFPVFGESDVSNDVMEAFMGVAGIAPKAAEGVNSIYEYHNPYTLTEEASDAVYWGDPLKSIGINPKTKTAGTLKGIMAHEVAHNAGFPDIGMPSAYDVEQVFNATRRDKELDLLPGQKIDPRILALQKTLTTKKK